MSLMTAQKNALIAKALNTALGRAQLAQAMVAPLSRPPIFHRIIIAACPVCGSLNIDESFAFKCKKCGWKGPDRDTMSDAMLAWNKASRHYGHLVVEIERAV